MYRLYEFYFAEVAVKPYTDTVKGFQNVLVWKSQSYTLIVFLVSVNTYHFYLLLIPYT